MYSVICRGHKGYDKHLSTYGSLMPTLPWRPQYPYSHLSQCHPLPFLFSHPPNAELSSRLPFNPAGPRQRKPQRYGDLAQIPPPRPPVLDEFSQWESNRGRFAVQWGDLPSVDSWRRRRRSLGCLGPSNYSIHFRFLLVRTLGFHSSRCFKTDLTLRVPATAAGARYLVGLTCLRLWSGEFISSLLPFYSGSRMDK